MKDEIHRLENVNIVGKKFFQKFFNSNTDISIFYDDDNIQ